MRPSLKECEMEVHGRAVDIATRLLEERGLTFRTIKDFEEARKIIEGNKKQLIIDVKADFVGAAACVMQTCQFLSSARESDIPTTYLKNEGINFFTGKTLGGRSIIKILGEELESLSEILCKWSDDLFYKYGDSNEALDCYQLAAGLCPSNEDALWNAISVCLQGSPFRPQVALPYAVVIADLNPARDEVDYILSCMDPPNNPLDNAIIELKKTINVDSNNAQAYSELGEIYMRKGLFDDAIKEYKEALRINPNYSDAHNCLGNVLRDQGMFDHAIKEYKEAIAINPNESNFHYNLGLALYKRDFLYDSIKAYREAIKLNKSDADYHYALGLALMKTKRIELKEEAIGSFEKSIKFRSPKDKEIITSTKKTIEVIKQYFNPAR